MRPFIFPFALGKMFAAGGCLAIILALALATPGCATVDQDDNKTNHASGDGDSSGDVARFRRGSNNLSYGGWSDQANQIEKDLAPNVQ